MQRGHRLFATRARALALSRSMLSSSRMGQQSHWGLGRFETRQLASTSRPIPPKDESQAAIERSEQLHAELKQMIEAQKAKAVEERARPFGSNFVHFVKSSKPQMINIFFSFVCVLLAYQIHAMRAGIKKLMAENEEKDEEVGRLRGILAELSREPSGDGPATFASAAASRCADIVRGRFSDSEKRAGTAGYWG
ncbi:hypothetical protein THAOC_08483, partial [Thalassiosira oceanica]